jgi:transposase
VDTLGKAYMGVLMAKRKRQSFTPEFKAETVRLVLNVGKSIPEVARDLDLTESALRLSVHLAKVDRGQGKPGDLTTADREELQRLRREVKRLTASPDEIEKHGKRKQRDGQEDPHLRLSADDPGLEDEHCGRRRRP